MEIRPALPTDVPALARIHVDSWRATYVGIVPAAYLDGMSYTKSEATWQRVLAATDDGSKRITLVAHEEGVVAGYATGGSERSADWEFDGELYAIYLRPSLVRQGVGRLLATELAGNLIGFGFHSMLVWVLAANPACRFYEALGGQAVRQTIITLGGLELVEVGFGWADLRKLIA